MANNWTNRLLIKVKICEISYRALVDTGAIRSCIGPVANQCLHMGILTITGHSTKPNQYGSFWVNCLKNFEEAFLNWTHLNDEKCS